MVRNVFLALCLFTTRAGGAEIERIWLTHNTSGPTHMVVNWETDVPGNSIVEFGLKPECEQRVAQEDAVSLHHVQIALPRAGVYYYRVRSGDQRSDTHRLKSYANDVLRVGIVADWQAKPSLEALLNEDLHLLLSAGDLVANLHTSATPGDKDNTKPFSQLVAVYPELFRSVPFLPVLGNHDREIRPRGNKPPAQPVYDVEATAFRSYFPLPDEGWKWHFDVPAFEARFIALDLSHISDQGTTWQTCHALTRESDQFRWYQELSARNDRRFVVTLYNEQNQQVRAQANGDWGKMIQRGTAAVTGFGYFAERAEINGFPYFNTALGKGAAYRDTKGKFFKVEPSYLLLTFAKGGGAMQAELKDLHGHVLDKSVWNARPIETQ